MDAKLMRAKVALWRWRNHGRPVWHDYFAGEVMTRLTKGVGYRRVGGHFGYCDNPKDAGWYWFPVRHPYGGHWERTVSYPGWVAAHARWLRVGKSPIGHCRECGRPVFVSKSVYFAPHLCAICAAIFRGAAVMAGEMGYTIRRRAARVAGKNAAIEQPTLF